MYYLLNWPFALRKWKNISCGVVNLEDGTLYYATEDMWTILECCDGTVDMDCVLMSDGQYKIFKELCQRQILSPAQAGGILQGRQRAKVLPFDYVKSLHWSITGKCNLRCKHCYMSAPKQKYQDLTMDQIKNLINQMQEAEIHRVSITGGEPLTRKDFWEIMKLLKEADIHVYQIYSNGLLVDDNFLERLREEQVNCEFVLSYDGVTTHDWLRGIEGTEDKTIEAIQRIKNHQYPVSIETALYEDNLAVMPKTYELLRDLQVNAWKCSCIMDSGEWKEQRKEVGIEQKELYRLYDKLIAMHKQDGCPMNVQFDGYYSYRMGEGVESVPYRNKSKEDYSCGTCIMQPYLLPNGRLIPCPGFTDTCVEQDMPFVTEKKLSDIFSDQQGAFYKLTHVLSREIKEQNENCRECQHKEECSGGCRAMALLSGEDLYGRDLTMCHFFRDSLSPAGA